MQIWGVGRRARVLGCRLESMRYMSSAEENHMHEQGGGGKFFLGHFHHIKAFSLCSTCDILSLLGFLYSTKKMRQPPQKKNLPYNTALQVLVAPKVNISE